MPQHECEGQRAEDSLWELVLYHVGIKLEWSGWAASSPLPSEPYCQAQACHWLFMNPCADLTYPDRIWWACQNLCLMQGHV